jgi:uncharacterized protein YcnI
VKTLTTSVLAVGGAVLLTTGAALVAAPLSAQAHVTVTPNESAAGSYSVLTFSVGHGCDGSPTTSVTFSIPEEIESVTPTVNSNWTITDGDDKVTYTAITPLPDGQRDTFQLSVRLPAGDAGDTLAFPVLQVCEAGQTDWAETAIEGQAEPAHPAPTIVLSEASTDAHGHGTPDAEPAGVEHDAAGKPAQDDPIARGLGIGGLVLGAIGLAFGVSAHRNSSHRKAAR